MKQKQEEWFMYQLPIGNVAGLKRLVQFFRSASQEEMDLERFFSLAIMPFYDCMHGGIERMAGHVLYRLSDFLPLEHRKDIYIYPDSSDSSGSLVVDDSSWHSLEDWRKEWESLNPHIPSLTKSLPGEIIKLLPEKLPQTD